MSSINERQYQLPFCQVLAARGETIFDISSHGPLEKGKDVITRDAEGNVRAYQLKAGDISVGDWRKIHGELVDLVELPIEHPSLGLVNDFIPYLVTNRELNATALEQVRSANLGWKNRGFPDLRIIQKGELLDLFRSSHGAYLPHELHDFNTFLELILREGSYPADKLRFSRLLEDALPSIARHDEPKRLGLSRAAASAVLLTAYIVKNSEARHNHWCLFEYWVISAAYILRLAEEYSSGHVDYDLAVSFDICQRSAEAAIAKLSDESERAPNLIQGDPLIDSHIYASRMTILCGVLSSEILRSRIRNERSSGREFILGFIRKNLRHAVLWGETAVPLFLSVALALDLACRPADAEGLALQVIRELSENNGVEAKGRGLPNVYYGPEASVRLVAGLDLLNTETFVGFSYTLPVLIEFLARRWRRQALALVWYGLTRISLLSYVPASPAEWYRWGSDDGVLNARMAGEPQSWTELVRVAEDLTFSDLPKTLVARPEFAVWFMLVYPQRLTTSLAKLIEANL